MPGTFKGTFRAFKGLQRAPSKSFLKDLPNSFEEVRGAGAVRARCARWEGILRGQTASHP
jgi:hypothetical protein